MKQCVIGQTVRASLLLGIIATFISAPATAASVAYILDQSNALPDGVDYVQVTISDSEITEGDIDFVVEVLAESLPEAGSNFGLQSFYLNADEGIVVTGDNVLIDTSGWKVNNDRNAGGSFGKYEIALKGTGNSRTETLEFSISGIDDDTIHSYAIGSSLNPSSGEFFAAHIAGFSGDPHEVTSAKFAGSALVPLPPALFLFASALGLIGWRRRRAS